MNIITPIYYPLQDIATKLEKYVQSEGRKVSRKFH